MKRVLILAAISTVSLAGSAFAQTQIVTPDPVSQGAVASTPVSFQLNYTTILLDPTLTGLGVRMHFDSSKLAYVDLTNILPAPLLIGPSLQDDTGNEDGDAATDKIVLVAWTDPGGNWPGSLPATLYTANFTTAADFSGSTTVNFTASSVAAGYVFDSTPATITAPSADLSVSKSDEPDPAIISGIVWYTITYGNAGPDDATGVQIVDTLDPLTNFMSADPQGGCTPGLGIVTCTPNGGVVPSGGGGSFQIVVMGPPEPATVTNTVEISGDQEDPNLDDNLATEDTTFVLPTHDLSVSKTDSVDPVYYLSPLTYTITFNNAGPDQADGVIIVDTLPFNAVFQNASLACTHDAGVVTCNVGPVPSQAGGTLTITVLAPDFDTLLENTVEIQSPGNDPNPDNDTYMEATNVTAPPPAQSDLAVFKSGPTSVKLGENFSYTITVTNNGPDADTGVEAVDTLPAEVGFVSAPGCGEAAGAVTCAVGDLANGASANFTVNVSADSLGTALNIVTVDGNGEDNNLDNNTAEASTEIVPLSVDLQVSKSGPGEVTIGGQVTYALGVTNNGPDPDTNVQIVDTLPAGTAFVSASPACNHSTGVVTCTIGDLGPGGSSPPLEVVVTAPTSPGDITNVATASGSEEDSNPENNTAIAVTTVRLPAADLTVNKTGPGQVLFGGGITYTLAVTNNGPDGATGVEVVDTLPAGVTFVSASAGCVEATGTVTCTIGDLANGAGANITIDVTAPEVETTLTNTATVSGDQDDPNPDNDSSSAATNVVQYEPQPIPTLSEWGLMALAGLLALIGLWTIRRRQTTA